MLSAGAAAAMAGNIGPGSSAPKLIVKKWLKGAPIEKLDPKGTYVVEFWATWCGPCLESIPHVTESAKKNTDVTFIGIGIWEDPVGDNLERFVARMGDKMDYRVAYSGNKDGMAKSWMEPAAQDGIPTAFIVKEGRIMWIGHPLELDKPLSEVKAGTFDIAVFKKAFDRRAERNRARMAANKEYAAAIKLYDDGKKVEASKALTRVVAKHPQLADSSERVRYEWMSADDPAAWLERTKALVATGNPESLQMVASFALRQAQRPEGVGKARTAIGMVLQANAKDDWDLLNYGRTIYLKLGDHKEALEVTDKMIELYPTGPWKDNPQLKDVLLKGKADLEAKLAGKSAEFSPN